jgi:hypothetical protein
MAASISGEAHDTRGAKNAKDSALGTGKWLSRDQTSRRNYIPFRGSCERGLEHYARRVYVPDPATQVRLGAP